MLHGFATPEGTERFAERFALAAANGFFRQVNGLRVSALGLGTYLGEPDAATDSGYASAAVAGLRGGINFFDTAINYRGQRSERALGSAFRALLNANEIQRDQFVISTKAGFLTPGAVPESLKPNQIAGGIHSMDPAFLEHQINCSRENLDLDTIDIFYLHNPETWLQFVPRAEFESRLQSVFELLERLASDHVIRWYGTATWDGYRQPGGLDLQRVVDLARYVAGDDHHFRFVQLPFSLGMIEAYTQRNAQGVSVLKTAERAGITVVASATLLQGRFSRALPPVIRERIPGLRTDAARAIQFARSTPGISVALAGMSRPEHVQENLEITQVVPMGAADYEKLYRPVPD